jgi:uncharacterized protein (PEP-CTERM system associated)
MNVLCSSPFPAGLAVFADACLAGLLMSTVTGATAQTAEAAAGKQLVSIVPRVSVTETLTSNVNLSNTDPKSEQTTEVAPGVRISIKGARLRTYLDYSVSRIAYAQGTSADRNQNALNTFGSIEAIDNWAFVEFSGTISQQTVSAFGTQSSSNAAINSNRTEVSNYRLAPYVRGRFGSLANYEVHLSRTVSSTDANASANSASTDDSIKFSNATSFSRLGWSVDVSRQRMNYSTGRPTESDNAGLGLLYTFNPQLKLSVNAGRESSNFTSLDKQSSSISSLSLNWMPSERTKLSAGTGQRSFGNTHNLSFEHRSARTALNFSDSKDVSTSPGQNGIGRIGSTYDLFFSQFAAVEPDPIARAQLVNNFLQTNGISPTGNVVGNFFTTAVSLQRRQDLSFALMGVRDTVTFVLTRTQSNRLDTMSTSIDNLTSADSLTQHGFSVNYSHRLTPDHSLGVLLSQQNTAGSTTAQESTLNSLNVNVTAAVGKRTSATLGARRIVFDSLANSYAETAVTGNLNVRF